MPTKSPDGLTMPSNRDKVTQAYNEESDDERHRSDSDDEPASHSDCGLATTYKAQATQTWTRHRTINCFYAPF